MTKNESLSLVDRLAAIPYTGAISDILDEMGLAHQTLPPEIQSIFPGQTLAGRALTVLGEPSASTDPHVIFIPFLKMLGEIRAGAVLVSQPQDTLAAHLGELSSETAQYRGARGAVINGGARHGLHWENRLSGFCAVPHTTGRCGTLAPTGIQCSYHNR